MANRNARNHPWALHERLFPIMGSFVPLTGAGTIVASKVTGYGFGYAPINGVMALQAGVVRPGISTTPGILRTGTGLYTVTLDDSYVRCLDFRVNIAAAAGNTVLDVMPVEPATNLATSGKAPTFSLQVVNTTTGNAAEAAASMRIYFQMWMDDSSVQWSTP